MQTADNLAQCNHYFKAQAVQWSQSGKDPRWIRVKIAKRFSRLLFAIVAGRQLFAHPCRQPQSYLLGKLLEFHADHQTPPAQLRQDLEALVDQLPASARTGETQSLAERLEELAQRRRGPQPLADILPLILARLGLGVVQSTAAEEPGP